MKLTKSKLKQIIREEIQKLNEGKTFLDIIIPNDIYVNGEGITSLEGAPKTINGDFDCFNNKLTSLKGAPTKVNGHFYCRNNPGKFTEEDVKKVCKVGGKIFV